MQFPERKDPKITIFDMTPRQAQDLLDADNTHNRRLRPSLVDTYVRDILADKWPVNGETIKIAEDGTLLDGQHRLAAIAKSGRKVRVILVRGLPLEAQETIDIGSKRTTADVLSLRGESHSANLASVARRALIYVRGGYKDVQSPFNNPSTLEIADAVDQYPLLREAAAFGAAHRKDLPVPPSVLGFAYWACLMKDEDDAKEFFDQAVTGTRLEEGDPALTLRKRLMEMRNAQRGRLDERTVLALFFQAWNAWRKGRSLKIIRFSKNQSFPTPE